MGVAILLYYDFRPLKLLGCRSNEARFLRREEIERQERERLRREQEECLGHGLQGER